jgi:hypothetical protein
LHGRRDEDKVAVHHFADPGPGLSRVFAHDIREHATSVLFFRLIFTEKPLSIV